MDGSKEVTLETTAEPEGSTQLIELGKSSIVAILLQFTGVALAYLVQILLARWMGKTEYGIYEYAMTWSLLLAVPASLGLPRAVVRFINEYQVKQEWGLLRGLILGSWQLTIAGGLCLSGIGSAVIFLINAYYPFSYAPILLISIWLIPLQALVLLQEDMARGTENLILAYTPTRIIWPILVILGAEVLWYEHFTPTGVSMIWVALATLFGTIATQAGFVWFQVERKVIPPLSVAMPPVYTIQAWLEVALPLLLFRVFRELLVQTDILMLGAFTGAAAVGIYSSASKTAFWVSFVLQAINIAVAPTFATLYAQGKLAELQKVISAVTIWILGSSSFIALILVIFAKPILGTFGAEFIQAHWALKILVIGQLINALSGSVGILLAMTGYQNQLMLVSVYTALINLVLNAVAIPILGIVGAALTTALTLSIWNIWLAVVVMRNLKVNPTVFSGFGFTKS